MMPNSQAASVFLTEFLSSAGQASKPCSISMQDLLIPKLDSKTHTVSHSSHSFELDQEVTYLRGREIDSSSSWELLLWPLFHTA